MMQILLLYFFCSFLLPLLGHFDVLPTWREHRSFIVVIAVVVVSALFAAAAAAYEYVAFAYGCDDIN